jgi:hypothetical protein
MCRVVIPLKDALVRYNLTAMKRGGRVDSVVTWQRPIVQPWLRQRSSGIKAMQKAAVVVNKTTVLEVLTELDHYLVRAAAWIFTANGLNVVDIDTAGKVMDVLAKILFGVTVLLAPYDVSDASGKWVNGLSARKGTR